MLSNLVPDSRPVALHSPYLAQSRQLPTSTPQHVLWLASHIRLELYKLQAAAVKRDNVLALGRLALRVDGGRGGDGGGMFALRMDRRGQPLALLPRLVFACLRRTLQFLQRQTKLASPLLPLISFCSYCDSALLSLARPGVMEETVAYKAAHAHPVGVRLAAGSALDFEGVVEGVVGRVVGAEVCHAAGDVRDGVVGLVVRE